MALLQALLVALTRSTGKLLNTAFAWATVLLFGRVSQDQPIYVSVIAFGSVIWLIALIGVAFPAVSTVLLSFVPLPDWVDKKWVRLAMLVAVVALPLVVGLVESRPAVRLQVDGERNDGAGRGVRRGASRLCDRGPHSRWAVSIVVAAIVSVVVLAARTR